MKSGRCVIRKKGGILIKGEVKRANVFLFHYNDCSVQVIRFTSSTVYYIDNFAKRRYRCVRFTFVMILPLQYILKLEIQTE
jgi:hypothetical protein